MVLRTPCTLAVLVLKLIKCHYSKAKNNRMENKWINNENLHNLCSSDVNASANLTFFLHTTLKRLGYCNNFTNVSILYVPLWWALKTVSPFQMIHFVTIYSPSCRSKSVWLCSVGEKKETLKIVLDSLCHAVTVKQMEIETEALKRDKKAT